MQYVNLVSQLVSIRFYLLKTSPSPDSLRSAVGYIFVGGCIFSFQKYLLLPLF